MYLYDCVRLFYTFFLLLHRRKTETTEKKSAERVRRGKTWIVTPYSPRSFPRGAQCPRGFIRKVTYLEVIPNASFSTGVPPLFVEKYYASISLFLSLSFS